VEGGEVAEDLLRDVRDENRLAADIADAGREVALVRMLKIVMGMLR
jgi:hypothetical protein